VGIAKVAVAIFNEVDSDEAVPESGNNDVSHCGVDKRCRGAVRPLVSGKHPFSVLNDLLKLPIFGRWHFDSEALQRPFARVSASPSAPQRTALQPERRR